MTNSILQEIQKEVDKSNELNETIKEFKEVVENFILNLEYFEEMYRLQENSAKAIDFIKNFAGHIEAVNAEYQNILDAQASLMQTEQSILEQISQKLMQRLDIQLDKLYKDSYENLEKRIAFQFDKLSERIEKRLENQFGKLSDKIKNSLDTHISKLSDKLERTFIDTLGEEFDDIDIYISNAIYECLGDSADMQKKNKRSSIPRFLHKISDDDLPF